ncbi:MAG: 4-hydroxy-3-methylbut-2-enyl diphosphate reductase [Deltaproteobacteria bacterium]|nr:4-hydroxy-3-methylbut-2-enyl diphosphate reductase [Deltaproteobacteria bacterium]
MKITVAKNAGFCFGVRRALDITFKVRHRNPGVKIYTLGPIIHNPQVIKAFLNRGIGIIEDPLDPSLKPDDIVIVRAHGIAPEKKATLKARGIKVIDATCPMVLKVHSFIKRATKSCDVIVIIGDKDHPEVDGHLAMAGDKGKVIQGIEDANKTENVERMAVVAQTTFDVSLYKKIITILRGKAHAIDVFGTICESTTGRQKEVGNLAKNHDTFIVVGGRNSANTSRLEEIARSYGKRVIRIEAASELEGIDTKSMSKVAILAGASTPQWVIEECISMLKRVKTGPGLKQTALDHIAYSPICPSLGSLGLAMAAFVFCGLGYNWYILLSVFFLTFSSANRIRQPSQWIRWGICAGIANVFAYMSIGPKGLMLVASVAFLRPLLCIRDVEDYVRSIFGFIVFIIASIVVPLSLARATVHPAIIILGAYIATHYLGIEILKGLKDIERDSIQGKMSMARYLNEPKAILTIEYNIMGMALILFLSFPLKVTPALSYGLIPPLFFLAKGIDICTERRIFDSRLFNIYLQCLWLILPFMGLLWRVTMME